MFVHTLLFLAVNLASNSVNLEIREEMVSHGKLLKGPIVSRKREEKCVDVLGLLNLPLEFLLTKKEYIFSSKLYFPTVSCT